MDKSSFQHLREINRLADSINKNALGVNFYTSTILDNVKAIRFAQRVIALTKELESAIEEIEQLIPVEETA